MLKLSRLLLIVSGVLVLTSCLNLAPDYQRPDIDLPEDWGAHDGNSMADVGQKWWKVFNDPRLDLFIDEALQHNTDLAAAVARVDEARALLGESKSERYPSLDATYSRDRTQSSLRSTTTLPPGTPRTFDNYRGTANVSYELDLWGRIRNTTVAKRAELLATEAARETVFIVLIADVVQSYFSLLAFDEQLAATQRSVISRAESLALQQLRYKHGFISEFEYRQLEAEVEAARAQLPALQLLRLQQETALAVLLGRSPKSIYQNTVVESNKAVQGSSSQLHSVVDAPMFVVPAGLPSELLLRRPDLMEAEQRLISTNAQIGVARAAYFPTLSLTGFLGSESEALSDLFSSPADIAQWSGSITQPLWRTGLAGYLVKAAKARRRQALAAYQRAIQNAFRDVRNAIIAQTKTYEQYEAEHRRVAALNETLRLAKLRYENGVASQLDVLDAERNLLSAELNRSDAQRAHRAAIADLYKALGGGWSNN